MPDEVLTKSDVANLIEAHFGNHVSTLWLDKNGGVTFQLLDAFLFSASPDNYGSGHNWGFGLHLGGDYTESHLLGRSLTILSTTSEISAALRVIEQYARLRLSPEYIEAFEAAPR